MIIIAPGDLTRELRIRRFYCQKCGCIFDADMKEYRVESDYRNGTYTACSCPTCGHEVYNGVEVAKD